MGKGRRYSVFLTGQLSLTANNSIKFNFDLRTLIPIQLETKKFLLYSSFDTNLLGTTGHGGLRVSVNFSQGFNKNFQNGNITGNLTPPNGICLGVAYPIAMVQGANTQFKYEYQQNECNVVMIDYPDAYPLEVQVSSNSNQAVANVGPFRLNLTFEELED